MYSKQHPEFITITCLEWKPVLSEDRIKDIIVNSLSFLTKAERITVYGFVILNNQLHLIWQIMGEHQRDHVQRDLLKFTSQQILKHLRSEQSTLLKELLVEAQDRRYQVWKRNLLGIALWSEKVFLQKLYVCWWKHTTKAGCVRTPTRASWRV